MASKLSPAFAYTVVYVKDVAKSVDFYAKAFGYGVRHLDLSHRWGELDSGQTTIAFTPAHQHETDDLTGTVQTPRSDRERNPVEVAFDYPVVAVRSIIQLVLSLCDCDCDCDDQRAVENGAVPVSEPQEKEWGQKVGYVRDIDGMVVRMGSYVGQPKSKSN